MNKIRRKLVLPALGATAMILSGCNFLTGLEKDLTVVLNTEDGVFATCQVNIFNNYYLKETPPVSDTTYMFYGWSPKEDFIPEVDDSSLLLTNKQVIRYNDVVQWAQKDSNIVDLYAVIAPRPVYDLVIGWYNKVSTSGLTEDIINKYVDGVEAYLDSQGHDHNNLKIDVRGYEGDVATVGSKVNADTDVNVLVGMGSNIQSQGGINYVELIDGITMGTKTKRNIALVVENTLGRLVFEWSKTAEAQALLV